MQLLYENFLDDVWEHQLNKYHIKNLLLNNTKHNFNKYDSKLFEIIFNKAIKEFDCEYVNIYKFYSQIETRLLTYIHILYKSYMKKYTRIQKLANQWIIYKLYNPKNGKKYIQAKKNFKKQFFVNKCKFQHQCGPF